MKNKTLTQRTYNVQELYVALIAWTLYEKDSELNATKKIGIQLYFEIKRTSNLAFLSVNL